MKIAAVSAMEILDSRGNPTVEATVTLEDGSTGRAAVPSGASTGVHEALELRDGDEKRFGGKGVTKAVENVIKIIGPVVIGHDAENQMEIDNEMLAKDGSENLKNLGANAVLSVSLAVAKAAAASKKVPLYQHFNDLFTVVHGQKVDMKLPVATFNVMNGGAHTNWESTDFQEFMIVPHKAATFTERLEQGAEIYHTLKSLLKENGLPTLVGDEGGFAPKLKSNEEAVEYLIKAIEKAGFNPGEEVSIALDPATSELYDKDKKTYTLKTQNQTLSSDQMVEKWLKWVSDYPIISLEDGLAEDDWEGWQNLYSQLADKTILVGDDFLVTNPDRIAKAIDMKTCNALLTKVNQIGSLTEAMKAVSMSKKADWKVIISHRSGETADTTIADLSVGVGADFAKMGATARSERVGKYNQLMRVEKELMG